MNRIAMAKRSAILALWRQGWSFRRIARERLVSLKRCRGLFKREGRVVLVFEMARALE